MQYVPTEADAAHETFKAAGPEWLADILSELFAAFRTGAVGMMTPDRIGPPSSTCSTWPPTCHGWRQHAERASNPDPPAQASSRA